MQKKITNKNIKEEKGITLIALVITIIVLLILAGVAISILSGENGIITKASEASEQTKNASTYEHLKLAITDAMLSSADYTTIESADKLNEALVKQGVTGANVEGNATNGYVVTVDKEKYKVYSNGIVKKILRVENNVGKEITGEKAVLLDANNEQIVVPVGFRIKEDSPTEVKKGIVVVAPDKSEFVWVPVKDASTMYGTDVNENKLGKLYSFTSTGYSALNWTEENGIMSWKNVTDNRETDYLSDTTNGDAVTEDHTKGIELLKSIVNLSGTNEEILSAWQTQLQKEYSDMIESVSVNKGFYVGRYETSLNATTGYAQSISGETSATAAENSANTWYGLYQKQKDYSKDNTKITNSVGSSMIWGSQYDQMMIWMQSNEIDVASTTTSGNTLRTTGINPSDKLNNIYDLQGNSFEWTLEASDINYRILRGGVYFSSKSPSDRFSNNPWRASSDYDSRISLYVN